MATGTAQAAAQGVLALLLNGTTYTAGNGPLFMQLHLGEPGASGIGNPAVNTTRQAAGSWTFSNTGGLLTAATAAGLTWTSVPATETYAYFSLWTASTAGTFVLSGDLAGGTVTAGQTFVIDVGQAEVTIPIAG